MSGEGALSFNEGETFGYIKGGEHNGQIVHRLEIPENNEEDIKKFIDEAETLRHRLSSLLKQDLKTLSKEDKRKIDKDIERLNKLNELIGERPSYIGDEIKLLRGEMIPMPNIDTRDCLYICGQSGSGKSTYASMYIKSYKTLWPDKEVYLFSRVAEDEVLDELNPTRVRIDESIADDPFSADEFRDCLCVFDDIDTISNNKIRNALVKFIDDLLEVGRHTKTYVVRIAHLTTDYKATRKILNECTSITLFPKYSSYRPIEYVLKEYFGMRPKQIEKLMQLPSRWITLYKNFPNVVMYKKGAYILHTHYGAK